MNGAACLVLFAIVIAMTAPRGLPSLTRSGSSPRLGVGVWLLVVATALLSVAAAVALLAHSMVRHGRSFGTAAVEAEEAAFHDLMTAHIGAHADLGIVALTTAVIAWVCWKIGGAVAGYHRSATHHSRTVRSIGRKVDSWNAVIVETSDRIAYCVAGRDPVVVISSGAADVLGEHHLRAVLAHERAHLTGRHHRILGALRALANASPRIRLFAAAHADVARLLEMCADDTAVRAHGPRDLLGAMIALSGPTPVPDPALGSTSVDVLARAGRLARPVRATRRLVDRAALLTSGAIAVSPSTVAVITTLG